MSKFKAKLTALLMAAACCLACIGIGVSFNKANQVVASAATLEEEFTNNGQFTVGQFRDDMPFEIVDSTAEGVPEGAEGAVLKITGVGDQGVASDGAFATLDFSASKILVSGADIIVRVYQAGTQEFRVSKKAGSAEWRTTVKPAAGWTEVRLSGATNATEDHQIMTTISMGFRRGTACYIDSITVVDNDAKKDFTNNGQFNVIPYASDSSKPLSVGRAYYVDGASENLPEGYEGTVLKIDSGATQYVTLDFTGSKLYPTYINSIKAKCYLPDAYKIVDGVATYDDSKYEFRLGGNENTSGGAGAYDMSGWFEADIPVTATQFKKDADGYLTTVLIGLRNKGATSSSFYIDSITVDALEFETVNVGPVGSYYRERKNASRAYFSPLDQSVTWASNSVDFTLEAGTGYQYIRNGETLATSKTLASRLTSGIKNFYISTSSIDTNHGGRQVGDIVRIGGTYYNKANSLKYVIEGSELVWNGTEFVTSNTTDYAVYNLGKLTVHNNSSGATTNVPNATQLYMQSENGMALPYPDSNWDTDFVLESGDGWKLNGTAINDKVGSLASSNAGLYVSLKDAGVQVGDKLTVSGTFVTDEDTAVKAKYIIEESIFTWNGTAWEKYVEYTTYNVGGVKFSQVGGDANRYVYLSPVSTAGFDTSTWNSGWDAAFSWKNGIGVTLNGETVSGATVKFPGSIFIDLGKGPQEGDILRVGGTFYNMSVAKQYIIDKTAFQYDGTKWDKYVEYTTYEIGQVALSAVTGEAGSATAMYLRKSSGSALDVTEGTWTETLSYESGTGVTLNGTQIDMSDIKFPGSLYVGLKTMAQKGDKVVIGGTFYNEALAVKYVIEDSEFWWNGTGWQMEEYQEPVIEYTIHTLGTLIANNNSNGTNATATAATGLYMSRTDGQALPYASWDAKFTLVSGDGWKLNGQTISLGQVVCSGDGLYIALTSANIKAGDVLTVSGEFAWEAEAAKLVIAESSFIWTGSVWTKYNKPTTYNIGKLAIDGGSTATAINFKKASGEGFEVKDGTWSEKLYFISGTGVGVTFNGTALKVNDCKIPNNMYLALEGRTAVAGDMLVIGGTFFNGTLAVEYVIEETTFVFDGTAWAEYVPPIEYTVYELNGLTLYGNSATTDKANAGKLHLKATGFTHPAEAIIFTLESGIGLAVNDQKITWTTFKNSADKYLYLTFNALNKGDKLTVGGTFVSEESAVKYIIEETNFWWNGTSWQTEEYVVQITTYEIGTLLPNSNSDGQNAAATAATALYMKREDGKDMPIIDGTWTALFTWESGDGWKLNGNPVTVGNFVSSDAGLYIDLKDAGVKVGDVITVSGTFYCESQNVKYVISESKLTWNGSKWEKHIEYAVYDASDLCIGDNSTATAVYFNRTNGVKFEKTDGTWTEKLTFVAGSGVGITLNGTQINMGDIKIPNNLYIGLGKTANVGDVLVIEGTFYNVNLAVKYVVGQKNTFVWSGSAWVKMYEEDELVSYDKVSLYDINMGTTWNVNGEISSQVQHWFQPSEGNSTNSLVFGFNIKATQDIPNDGVGIRLRGAEWTGFYFRLTDNYIELQGVSGMRFALELNKTYNIELAAIDLVDDSGTWCYIKVDGVIKCGTFVGRNDTNKEYKTNQVSLYAAAGVYANLSDNYNVMVTYVSSSGSYSEMAKVNELYTLATGKSIETFIGWQANGELWVSGAEYGTLLGEMTFTAVEIDFTMEEGASIRVGNSADNSGLRFTSMIDYEDLSNLANYGITNVSFGTLIVPYDYLEEGQKPNLSNFTAGEDIMQIVSTAEEIVDGYIGYRGTIQKIYTKNYGRLFAGRGYIEFTLKGQTYVVYTKFNNDDNVRSIRQVAQAFQADTTAASNGELRYADLSAERKAIVDAYALSDEINLMPYSEYANNATPVMAWNYPTLDPTNNYMNDTNKAIAQQMKDAGIKVVNLTGANLVFVNTTENIEKTRKIIKFFWSEGLYTAAFAANTGGIKDGAYGNLNCDLAVNGFPDFSECEGFIGFIAWDEPSNDQTVMNKLAVFAQEFEKKYAGTDVIFMVNLLPSYASIFQTSGGNWWDNLFGNSSTLDTAAFKAYLKQYCDTVLSQISGEKWLSLDTYPVYKDQSLADTFLFDLGALKVAALEAGAHSHVVLQSSGWIEGGSDLKSRIPTEAELRMQMYAAMAFGIDSISWFTYSPSSVNGSNTYNTPVDNAGNIVDPTGYAAFKTVNNEFNAISSVYGAFDWKGVIIGRGSKTGNEDYTAYDTVKGEIGSYELKASNTKHLSGVASNQSKMNYLMGIMEDKNGNEGYVLCNYNSIEEDRTQTITLTFNTNVTEVVIYRNGVAETVSVSNKTLTVNLVTGEGVIILPSKLG